MTIGDNSAFELNNPLHIHMNIKHLEKFPRVFGQHFVNGKKYKGTYAYCLGLGRIYA
jgi:hypothetical protein